MKFALTMLSNDITGEQTLLASLLHLKHSLGLRRIDYNGRGTYIRWYLKICCAWRKICIFVTPLNIIKCLEQIRLLLKCAKTFCFTI